MARTTTRAGRWFILIATVPIAGYGVVAAVTRRMGRGAPVPVEGPIPLVVGGCFVAAGAALFLAAWLRPVDEPPGGGRSTG